MDLRKEILKEHSKAQAEKIAKWIGSDTGRFEALMLLFLHDEYRIVQRSAWIISSIAECHPELITPWLEPMVGRMREEGIHVAVRRNIVRILRFIPIPEKLHGLVMNACFDFLADPSETVAVRCFSMTVLANLAQIYPEIKQEIRLIIEDALQHETTAGFRSRAKKTLVCLTV